MCATVCPSQALAYVRPEELSQRREKPSNTFYFGNQQITTKVFMMLPESQSSISIDVADYTWEGESAALSTA